MARTGVPSQVTPFARLAAVHAIGTAGDAFVTVALAGSLFFTTAVSDARPRTALYLAFTMAPFAVVAPLIGPLLDRLAGGRRLIVVATLAARVVLCLAMASNIDGLLLYPLAFGLLVTQKAYSVAKSSLVPALVDDDTALVRANSRLSLIAVVGGAVGAVPAALVLQLTGGEWVLRLGSLVYGAGVIASLQIPRAAAPIPAATALEEQELRSTSIRLAGSGMGLLRGAVGFMTFLLAFELKSAGEPAWFFGLVIAASGAGSFLGAVVAPHARRHLREEVLLQLALLVPAVVSLLGARGAGRGSVLLVALFLGIGASAGKLAFDSVVQRDAPDASRGRAFASFEARFQVAWVAGALIPVVVPVFVDLPLRVGFLVLALVLGFAGLTYLGGTRAVDRGALPPGPSPGRRRVAEPGPTAAAPPPTVPPTAVAGPPAPPSVTRSSVPPPPPVAVPAASPPPEQHPPPPRVIAAPPPVDLGKPAPGPARPHAPG